MSEQFSLVSLLAGIGIAITPMLFQKLWNKGIDYYYRDVIKAYSILTARIMSAQSDLGQDTYKKTIEISMELARLRKWKVLKSILSDAIKSMESTDLESLYFHLGEETTKKWIKEWKENDKKKKEFINGLKGERDFLE